MGTFSMQLHLEALEQRHLLTVSVGDHILLPNIGGQTFDLYASEFQQIQGVDLIGQIADGGPGAGGFEVAPSFSADLLVPGAIFYPNNVGQYDFNQGSLGNQFVWMETLTAGGTVFGSGLLARLTIDTTGFTAGTWPLSLSGTVGGDMTFYSSVGDPYSPLVVNGSITIPGSAPQTDLNGGAGGTGYSTTWTNNGPVALASAANAFVSDDGTNLARVTATLDNPHSGDQLAANTVGTNIAAEFSGTTLSLTGIDTAAHYTQVLRTLTYDNTMGGSGVSSLTISIVANDGANDSAASTATVNVNLRPTIDLNGAPGGTEYTSNWFNLGPVPIVDSTNAILTDDGGNLLSLSASLVSPQSGDVLAANTAGTAISSSFDGTTLLLSGTASVVDYQQVLRSITYDNTSGGPGTFSASVNFVAYDGVSNSNLAVASVNINPVPMVDLNGTSSGTGFTSLWTSNSGPVKIADQFNATVTDNGSNLPSLTATLASPHPGDVLSANTSGTSISGTFTGTAR